MPSACKARYPECPGPAFHLPIRYQDPPGSFRSAVLRAGDQAVIQGEVELADIRFGRRRSLLVRLADGTGSITLRFFHFSAAQKANMMRGSWLRCFGEVRNGPTATSWCIPRCSGSTR